jgi:PAS domain S-box-containing protein
MSLAGMSLPRTIGAICGALTILLGLGVLAGWAVHSTLLLEGAPGLPPTQPLAGVNFAVAGMALLGLVLRRPRLTFTGSAIAAAFAAPSLLEYLVGVHLWIAEVMGRLPLATTLCFVVLAAGFVLAEISPPRRGPTMLGLSALFVGAMAAACCINVVWGGSNVFGLGDTAGMSLPASAGFLLLGQGAAAVALGISLAGLRQPAWAAIGAAVFVGTMRVGLLLSFSPRLETGISSPLSWFWAMFGPVVFGVFVHLALKAHLQRELLLKAEQATQAANEQLEQRVEERTSALGATNEELRKQKEILQTIFDHLPMMVGFVDEKGQAQVVNPEWEQTLGWTLEEIRGHNIDILAENYPDPAYRKKVRHFVANSNAEWADFKTTVRDGRVIDTSWAFLRLSDGSSIGIGQDITKRKRAEEALKESEERFRELAENITDLFWIKTADFKRVLYLSPVYKSLSGRAPEQRYAEHDNQGFLSRVVPEDRPRVAELVERGVDADFEIEFRIVRPNGEVRWIRDRGFPIRDLSGQINRIAGIATDITDRKLAEDALRESEERFRQLTENINEVFWLRSADLKQLLYVSPMYERVCGRTRESLYADGDALASVHPEDRPRVMETLEQLAGKGFEIEYRIITRDGDVRWLRDRGFPIRDKSGQVCRVGGVAEDITDRKEAEDRLKASTDQLRALSASLQSAREQEATRIAHQIHDDMGGVLTGLRWELEALQRMIFEPIDPWHLKVAMRSKLVAMIGLTDATINVVRRIASELRPSILDDLGLVEAIEWQTQQFQARTGIQCCCDCSSQSIQPGDQQSTAVFRIVQEALTNVLRHAQASQVRVVMREEDGILVLAVSDNGRGITEAEKASRESLGLLGMQERAHLIGGRVDIVGVPGAGTTLHVRVPLRKAQHAGAT